MGKVPQGKTKNTKMKNTKSILRKSPNGQNKTKMQTTKTKSDANASKRAANEFWQIGTVAVLLLVGLVIIGMTVSAANLKITYVNEDDAVYFASAAGQGAWYSGEYVWTMKLNPTESNFMSYLASHDSVFFSGHGNDDCIGGNNPNGFSGQVMCSNEINSCQATNEVTLMTCESYNDFGDELIGAGTSCVVGWPNNMVASQQTGSNWAWYFYYCAKYSSNSGACENWASSNSGLAGSAAKGSCSNTHGTSTGKSTSAVHSITDGNDIDDNDIKKQNKSYISDMPVKFKESCDKQGNSFVTAETDNGEVISYFDVTKYEKKGSKKITEKRALGIAKEKVKIPKDYLLSETEDEENSYNFMFNRVIEDVTLKCDWIWVSINKATGDVSMWSKVYHEELPDLKPAISKEEAIKIANDEFNGGAEISELTVVVCDENALCLSWLLVDSDSELYNYMYLDAHTGKRI